MKFAFYTLGCKVNQYETQAMQHLLLQQGHTLGDFSCACDGYIINTCTVTAVGDKKSRNAIRRAKKLNPNAVVGVCGCYSQVSPDEVRRLDVDVISGSGQREQFLELMVSACRDRVHLEQLDNALSRREFELLPAGGLLERTRAMLKVQDGCANFCSYCIIPYARGPVRSLPLAQAVAQALSCQEQGYQELVVTGIESSSWGQDLRNGSTLKDLLAALCQAVPSVRIRLGSLEPRTIDEAFCQALCGYENLCPQFHLSLQSGCDAVLKRMNRKYDTRRYLHSVELLRAYFPGCAITTDLIVAFPGETEEEFSQTLEFITRCRFASMHIFPYSRRDGTPAASMASQHSNETKEARSARAIALANQMERAYQDSLLGTLAPVLLEQEEDGFMTGHTPTGVKVYLKEAGLHNTVKTVRLRSICEGGVLGELASQA